MANEQLEKLITMALADGHISDDEWAILKRKAAALGVDEDELEMTILSKKSNQSGSQSANESSEILSQCPSCGSGGQRIISKCGYCGFTVAKVASQNTINNLLKQLMEAGTMKMEEYRESELNRDIVKNGKFSSGILGSLVSHANASSANLNEFQRKEKHIEDHKERVLRHKSDVISHFPLPDSPSELLEFISLAAAKTKLITKGLFGSYSETEKEHNALAPVWKLKCDQLMVKAKVALADDRSTFREMERVYLAINQK